MSYTSNESRQVRCSQCRKELRTEEAINYNSKTLCEDCCLNACMPRVRKTHWQYIRSIKADYLRPAKKRHDIRSQDSLL